MEPKTRRSDKNRIDSNCAWLLGGDGDPSEVESNANVDASGLATPHTSKLGSSHPGLCSEREDPARQKFEANSAGPD